MAASALKVQLSAFLISASGSLGDPGGARAAGACRDGPVYRDWSDWSSGEGEFG